MSYFIFRDCLFTAALFEELFKLNVPAIADLACKLPNYAFDPNVHPFRRSKAVEFLIIFWKNNRILQEMNEEFCDQLRKMSKRLYKGCLKVSCLNKSDSLAFFSRLLITMGFYIKLL